MCWRDDVHTTRHCFQCGKEYFGDLGHRGCPVNKAGKLTQQEGVAKPRPVVEADAILDQVIENVTGPLPHH